MAVQRKPGTPRAAVVSAEVWALFAEAQRCLPPTVSGGERFAPPWRKLAPSGKLGRSYGPSTRGAYDAAWSRWRESRDQVTTRASGAGAGLIDRELASKWPAGMRPREPEPVDELEAAQRWRRQVRGFLDAADSGQARVSEREREMLVLHVLEGRSRGETARLAGMSEDYMRAVYKQARARVYSWLDDD